MKSTSRPYRRSIWHHDRRYDLQHQSLGVQEFETIARLSSVDAAKKRIPPIPPHQLLEISKAAKAMPAAATVNVSDVACFLKAGLKHHGAGIPTLICILAVETQGAYPPMDRKFAAGLVAKQKVTPNERDALIGTHVKKFAEIYVQKVLPAWRESRKELSSEAADNYWGSAGADTG